jgi:hypothetical protein
MSDDEPPAIQNETSLYVKGFWVRKEAASPPLFAGVPRMLRGGPSGLMGTWQATCSPGTVTVPGI